MNVKIILELFFFGKIVLELFIHKKKHKTDLI